MSDPVFVFAEIEEGPTPAGVLYPTRRRGVLTTTFQYDTGYLGRRSAYAIDPATTLDDRPHRSDGLPAALTDAAPDRWGRTLIQKRERAAALTERRAPRTLSDLDYLLWVSDVSRQGALRLRSGPSTPFLADDGEVPRIIDLPRLLRAADQVDRHDDSWADVKLLLDAGSASLGGARPKASVRDEQGLAVAKFPHRSDQWDVMGWEKTVLDLAQNCGISVPAARLHRLGSGTVLLLSRFDRIGPRRLGYLSAMSMLGAVDGQVADYVEIAEAMSEHGAAVKDDLRELWRRMAFSIAVNNTDDHLRNHGFLRTRGGWRLAPAFDVNPNPDVAAARVTSIAGGSERADGIDGLLLAAATFGVSSTQACEVLATIIREVGHWRHVAARNGVPVREQAVFAECFEQFPDLVTRALG